MYVFINSDWGALCKNDLCWGFHLLCWQTTHSLLRVVFQAPGKATPAMPVRLVVSLSPFTQNFQWAQIVTYHYIVSWALGQTDFFFTIICIKWHITACLYLLTRIRLWGKILQSRYKPYNVKTYCAIDPNKALIKVQEVGENMMR